MIETGLSDFLLMRVIAIIKTFKKLTFFNSLESNLLEEVHVKVGLSPSKKVCFITCFNESPLKMMNNAFYFLLQALFVLKIFIFLS